MRPGCRRYCLFIKSCTAGLRHFRLLEIVPALSEVLVSNLPASNCGEKVQDRVEGILAEETQQLVGVVPTWPREDQASWDPVACLHEHPGEEGRIPYHVVGN